MKSRNGYDLNTLIIIANLCVCAIAIVFYYNKGANQYVDIYTVTLLCIFVAQNILMLLHERIKRDPFVLILMIVILIFYLARVVTLLNDPWSVALSMSSYVPGDLNNSLIFIMLSNISIFLGLSMARGKIPYKKEVPNEYPAKPRNIIIILVFALIVSFYISLASDILGRLTGYIPSVFIKLHLIILFTFVYLTINTKKMSRKHLLTISFFVITFFILFNTLHGCRSAVLTLAYLLLIAIISVKGRITFNNKAVLIGTILIPLSVILFISATYIRAYDSRQQSVISFQQLTLLKKSDIFGSKNINMLCRPIFDRMGFLDYSTVVIRNHEQYSKFINFQYLFKSIIDNALTPGFDIFATPLVSHSMSYIARGESVPTYEEIAFGYQSDMPTVYGEYYVLFHGYPALIILFVFSYIIKKIYLSIRSKDTFLFYMYRALVLYVFYLWLNSFGIDWMILDLIGIIITVGLFKSFYRMRRRELRPVFTVKEPVGYFPL